MEKQFSSHSCLGDNMKKTEISGPVDEQRKKLTIVRHMIRALCAANVLAKGRRGELLKMVSKWSKHDVSRFDMYIPRLSGLVGFALMNLKMPAKDTVALLKVVGEWNSL